MIEAKVDAARRELKAGVIITPIIKKTHTLLNDDKSLIDLEDLGYDVF